VRQLENICHWLTVMAPAQVVEAKDLPPELMPASRDRRPRRPCGAEAAAHPAAGRPRPAAAVGRGGFIDAGCRHAERAVVAGRSSARGAHCWNRGEPEVWDTLTRQFEAQLIHTALDITRGRRIEAAHKLGIGRNTITRKIQELGSTTAGGRR
jgi:two-component system nitrogen regulation response regulator GlnG